MTKLWTLGGHPARNFPFGRWRQIVGSSERKRVNGIATVVITAKGRDLLDQHKL